MVYRKSLSFPKITQTSQTGEQAKPNPTNQERQENNSFNIQALPILALTHTHFTYTLPAFLTYHLPFTLTHVFSLLSMPLDASPASEIGQAATQPPLPCHQNVTEKERRAKLAVQQAGRQVQLRITRKNFGSSPATRSNDNVSHTPLPRSKLGKAHNTQAGWVGRQTNTAGMKHSLFRIQDGAVSIFIYLVSSFPGYGVFFRDDMAWPSTRAWANHWPQSM